ncbi:hypothetical protein NLX86_00255 [Streptomyces sp. A3M-1-3]|nr:hypothetical protein [Streptomyces sp. A3M-1-3]
MDDDTATDRQSARLLPWLGPNGQPCYLSTDGHGYVTRVADQIEAVQLGMGAEVLTLARHLVTDRTATAEELRFTASRLSECLADALRVAESRGGRLRP